MKSLEQQALEYGQNQKALIDGLRNARSMLTSDVRRLFTRQRIEFAAKRMISDDEKLVLQWRVRPKPTEPIGPNNQQTSVGCVTLRETD